MTLKILLLGLGAGFLLIQFFPWFPYPYPIVLLLGIGLAAGSVRCKKKRDGGGV